MSQSNAASDAATDKQKAFIADLSEQKGMPINSKDELTKVEASKTIDTLLSTDKTIPAKRKESDETGDLNGHPKEVKGHGESTDTEDKPAKKQKTDDTFQNTEEQKKATGGDQPATNAQKAFIDTLADQAEKQDVDTTDMTRNEASNKIDELKPKADENQPTALEADKTPEAGSHLAKPKEWATGDEPATEKQGRYLAVLEKKAGETVEAGKGLSKGEASEKIQELKEKTD